VHEYLPRPTPSRRIAAHVAAAASLVLLAVGCGAGQEAATSTQVTHATGAVGQVGPISVLDVEFRFTPPIAGDEVYGVGDTAPMSVTIVNNGATADRLVRLSSPVAAAGVVVADGVVIPGGATLTAGQTGVSSIEVPFEDDAGLLALTGLREPLRSGLTYPVVLGFEQAGDLVLDVPVATPDVPRDPATDDR
jgi:copper(I)-binding protein